MFMASVASVSRRNAMIAVLNFATLVSATMLAAASAVAINWLALRLTFQLMRPASVRTGTASVRSELARGTTDLIRALTPHR
jgi:hypothetical protein